MSYAYAVEAETEISIEELRLLEASYEKEVREMQVPSTDTTFNYGWGLIRSHYKEDRWKGIQILEGKAQCVHKAGSCWGVLHLTLE